MARLLVQLKLRLLTNALRASTGAQVAFILSTLFAVVVAVGVFYLLSILGGGIAAADLTTVIFSVFAARVADPADRRLRPRQHPGSRHAGPLPAPDPPARGRPAGRLGHGRLARGHPDRPARGDHRAGPRRAWRAHRADRGAAAGAVLHHAGPVRDHRPGRDAPLAPRQGPRRPPDHPDLRGVRGLHPDRAEAGLRGRADRFELRGRGPVAAVDTAGPGRARDLGRLHGAPRHRAAAPGAAGRHHRRARPALDPVAAPRPGHDRYLHAVGGARFGAPVRPVRPARDRSRPVLALPATRALRPHLLGHHRGHHGGRGLSGSF